MTTRAAQEIRRTTNKAVVAGFVGQAILVVSGVVSARLLGPEGRGLLALLLVVPAVVAAVGVLGVPQALVMVSGREPGNIPDYLKAAGVIFAWQAISLMFLYAVALQFVTDVYPGLAWDLRTLSVLVLFLSLVNNYAAGVLQAKFAFSQLNELRIAPLAGYAAGVAGLWIAGLASVRVVLFVWVLVHAAYLCWKVLSVRGALRAICARPSRDGDVRRLLMSGISGHLGSLSTTEVLQADKLFVGAIMPAQSLGYFMVAQSFSNLPRIAIASASQVFSPSLASGVLEPRRFLRSSVLLGGAIAIAGGALLMVCQPVLIPFFFGEQFTESIVTAQYLIAAGVFGAIRRLCSDSMWALGKPRVGSVAEIVFSLVFGIGCAVVLFDPAIEKVALVIAIGQIAALLYAVAQLRRHFSAPILSDVSDS